MERDFFQWKAPASLIKSYMSLDEEDIQGRNWQEECAALANSHVLILDRVGISEDGYRVREMENETRSRGGERERGDGQQTGEICSNHGGNIEECLGGQFLHLSLLLLLPCFSIFHYSHILLPNLLFALLLLSAGSFSFTTLHSTCHMSSFGLWHWAIWRR